MKKIIVILFFGSSAAHSQTGWWQASLHREDGHDIVFTFEWKIEKGKQAWYIHNAAEKIHVTDIIYSGDSIFVQMPVFESQFRFQFKGGLLNGWWIKGGSVRTQVLPFSASPGKDRFPVNKGKAENITGRWMAVFTGGEVNDTTVAEFKQIGNKVSGTFMTATGDYRFLDGVVSQDSLFLSCFDGGHAFLFSAGIDDTKNISGGLYYSGARFKQEWSAIKDPKAKVPAASSAMYLRPGEENLDFTFNDLDGKPVSINDKRFKDKVVIVQIMGSWCPNCMDETAFLSDYYNKNKTRGLEIISLAYEYSTDINRSRKSLKKFQQKFNVQYPMLITGVTVNDSLRTEKTLPQLTPIRFFPSSVILDRKGKVRKLDTSFNGPGTGEHFIAYKKEFENTIDELLREH